MDAQHDSPTVEFVFDIPDSGRCTGAWCVDDNEAHSRNFERRGLIDLGPRRLRELELDAELTKMMIRVTVTESAPFRRRQGAKQRMVS